MRNTRPLILGLALCALGPASAVAQQRGQPRGDTIVQQPPPADVGPGDFGRFLFPPEIVMQHQRDIGLTDAQRSTITGAIQKLQSDVVPLQWKMADEQNKLTDIVRQATVDSAALLAQINKVLDLEGQIKRGQVAMLIRIKNTLTPDQQRALRDFMPRGAMGPLPGGGRGRGRGEGMGRGELEPGGELPPDLR